MSADPKRFNDRIFQDAPAQGNALRKQILTENMSVREAQEQMGHLESGSLVMRIPELDFAVLIQRFPELNSPDAETHTKAWQWFLRSPYSEPYRIRKNDGKRVSPR